MPELLVAQELIFVKFDPPIAYIIIALKRAGHGYTIHGHPRVTSPSSDHQIRSLSAAARAHSNRDYRNTFKFGKAHGGWVTILAKTAISFRRTGM